MKIAGVQMDVRLGDKAHNLNQIEYFAREAAATDAKLVVFPECAVTGYCFESLEEAMPFAEAFDNGTCQSVSRLQQICSELQIHIVAGMLERQAGSTEEDQLFNVCVCVGPNGLVGKYRKTHLPKLGVDHFATPGDHPYEVFQVDSVRIGMLICYDASFPEASRVLSLEGADLIVLPTNWPFGAEPTADYVINARASENKVYFISVDRIGLERGFQFIGKSKICDIHGKNLDVADHANQAIIYAEIDPQEARNKRIQRAPGHSIDRFKDRRPDLYGRVSDTQAEP